MIDNEEKAKFEKVYDDYKKHYGIVEKAWQKDAEEKQERIDHLSDEQRQAVRDIAEVASSMLDDYQAFCHPSMGKVVELDDRLSMLRHEFVLSTNL